MRVDDPRVRTDAGLQASGEDGNRHAIHCRNTLAKLLWVYIVMSGCKADGRPWRQIGLLGAGA
jgi:hypothetical protein